MRGVPVPPSAAVDLAGRDAPGVFVERVGRVGLAAYGAVYLLVGALGARIATLGGRAYVDQRGAVALVASDGLPGLELLAAAGLALVVFAVWQVRAACVGYRWVPAPGLRWRKRAGAAAKAVGVLSVAWLCARFVFRDPGDRRSTRVLVREVFLLPDGPLLVAAAAAAVLGTAVAIALTGVRRTFMGDLLTDRMPAWLVGPTVVAGVVGNLTRAVVFGTVGVLLARAALDDDPDDVGGLDLALRVLAEDTRGAAAIGVAALGLAAYGVYCLVDARFRHP